MKIWIDLTNSPHINFFKNFINHWKEDGNEIIITCRDLANTIDLIELNNWEYENIGGHAGKNSLKKLLYFPKRVNLLRKFLVSKKPDIGISHSSFYSPVTAKLLGIPSIYLNDNEHASGNYLAFSFATRVLLPECLMDRSAKSKWKMFAKIDFYPGIKEGIYLSQEKYQLPKDRSKIKKRIFIRPEPWTAQYYDGSMFFFDNLLKECKMDFEIILLPRGQKQAEYYQAEQYNGITIQSKSLSLNEIVTTCDLFIGAGGTMTREIAFLGIPTISIYQAELLEVDRYLIKNNYMLHEPKLTKEKIMKFLESEKSNKSNELFSKGLDAYNMIKNSIYEYKK